MTLSAIKNVQTTFNGSAAILEWKVNALEDQCIKEFRVEVNGDEKEGKTKENRFLIENLTPCSQYTVKVTPISLMNEDGNSFVAELDGPAMGKA